MKWIKNSNGKPDAMLTFASISFLVVTFNVFLATFNGTMLGSYTLNIQQMDSGIMAVFLGATFSAYVSRKATDVAAKTFGKNTEQPVESEQPDITSKV